MGLPTPGKQREPSMDSFSLHILKFELSGPDYENFSVVDLPGLFRSGFPALPIDPDADELQNLLQARRVKQI